MNKNSGKYLITAVALFCAAAIGNPAAFGATLTVTTLEDDGPGSFREALNDVDSGDTIDFAVTGTIVLTTFYLYVFDPNIIIRGPGADRLAISGSGLVRVFYIDPEAQGVTISGLTIRDGITKQLDGGTIGAGILNGGTVTLLDCAIVDNHATGAISEEVDGTNAGGGIYNGGNMLIKRCLIARNSVKNGYGGGIVNDGSLTIFNSTVAHNRIENDEMFDSDLPPSSGGGIHLFSGRGNFIADSCTIARNRITVTGTATTAQGGGIGHASASGDPQVVNRITNSIVALNSVTGDVGPDVHGAFDSRGFNLIGKGNDSEGFTNGAKHDQVGGAGSSPLGPKLEALADNGGPTFTMKLLAGSPALDQGRSSALFDQRGFNRHRDLPGIPNAAAKNSSDIGAFERAARP